MGTVKSHRPVERHKPWVDSERMRQLLRLGDSPDAAENGSKGRRGEIRAPLTKDFIDGAEEALNTAKMLRTEGNGTWAFATAYCSMFHVARALTSNAGLFVPRDTDRFVLMKIAHNYKRVVNGTQDIRDEVMWLTRLSMRDQRNDIVHSGLNHIQRETVNEAIARAESFLNKAKAVIGSAQAEQLIVKAV
ncbi:MAG: HEPN domain-containing protein [Candidatus Micrarchaeaceae archaeon]|nr:HEPN domain-containing protein [Candidatus Micrarchaeota archaeon]HII09889.1 HEPN domain-containing protein [Candidatus Micrarchaeota archaeon]